MNISYLLSVINVPLIGDLGGISAKYQWLLSVITWFINLVADVGLGIILFTLALKLITLPLDIFSRASMKKNALKMEMMRGDLEKLQKQYANNKQLYQQKMMALYKKNGYSAFSACLPTIVTLVFFFIVIGAFNSYSKQTDFQVFKDMGAAYDSQIVASVNEGSADGPVIKTSDGDYIVNIDYVLKHKECLEYFTVDDSKAVTDTSRYTLKSGLSEEVKKSLGIDGYFKEDGTLDYENARIKTIIRENSLDKYIREVLLVKNPAYYVENDDKCAVGKNEKGKYYFINSDLVERKHLEDAYCNDNGKFDLDKFNAAETYKADYAAFANEELSYAAIKYVTDDYKDKVILTEARKAAAETYEKNRSKSVVFPWVKNLWVVDSPFKSAIPNYSELSSTLYGKNGSPTFTEEKYNELTAGLEKYKQTGFGKGNGLFILVALSILTMLGSTLIMNKTQKTQMELSTVDGANGQAAMQQKMMTWMMPIMFGIFAFIYSAGFSIYMVTSSILSTLFTLLINFCVEKSFKNKIAKEDAVKNEKPRYGKRR